MNQAFKPAVFVMSLYLLTGAGLLTGCAGKQVKPTPEPTPPVTTEPEQKVEAPATEAVTKPEPYQYKAVPFEDVLKQDQEKAARKPAPKPVLPTGEDAPNRQPSTPLRPPKQTPAPEPEPETTVPEAAPLAVTEETAAPVDAPEAPEESAKALLAAPIRFSLDQLPLTIMDTWILAADQDSCSLQTVPETMDDGAGQTTVALRLSKADWQVVTQSDIDLSYPETGLFLSNGTHIPLESVIKDTRISISKQKQQLTEAIKASESVRVALGYWPTWPVTETRSITISVAHFPPALSAWESCNRRISAR
ncbi:MAG: hypothetical protein VYA55_18490 [Pseudomonadota bacterium]|nr:hypothetical protein [Pseudomonadota bacterium]